MPKNKRSKKQAARAKQRATGAPYTAAAGGSRHQHPAPDFGVMDSRLYGVTRQVNLAPAAALVGAARAGCRPCQDSAIPALVAGDRLVVANLAGLPFSLLPSPGLMAPASVRVWTVGRQMLAAGLDGPAPAASMLAVLEELSPAEVRDVVEDALDLWAALDAAPGEPAAAAAPPTGDGPQQDAEDDLPEATAPPENPFTGEGMMFLTVEQLADGIPLPMLVQSALAGTVDDQITEHAHDLFEALAERGPAAGREAALLLAQYMLSTGYYGTGTEAAVRYYRQQPPPMMQAPALTTLHLLVSAFIANGRPGAERILSDDLTAAELDGVVRFLFCIAAGMSGFPRNRQQALTEELCADVR
ncbi:hypothetical protein [Streptomyces sp. MJM8645]|uniref:hypothetical protein n=1 Tax=Streptomyces sp. MJM8645 TaxID=1120523 RepID=UPI000B08DE19|nr:hypothetical protein [Streptomyces sp. MJM8645]